MRRVTPVGLGVVRRTRFFVRRLPQGVVGGAPNGPEKRHPIGRNTIGFLSRSVIMPSPLERGVFPQVRAVRKMSVCRMILKSTFGGGCSQLRQTPPRDARTG